MKCPACASDQSSFLGVGCTHECQNCKTIFGSCTVAQKEQLIRPLVSHRPVITADCRYYKLNCPDESGNVAIYEGWYNVKEQRIAVLKNGVNDSHEPQVE